MENTTRRNIAGKIFIGLLCAVALVMPFHKVLPSPLLTLAALIGAFAGNFSQKWNRLKKNKPAFIFASVYLIAIAGYLLSANKSEAARDLQVKLSIPLIPIILCFFIELKTSEVILILRCFVLSCLAFAVTALCKATYDFTATGANHFYYKELVAFTFIHPSYIAMFEVFAIVLLLFKLFNGWKGLSKFLRAIHLFVIIFLVLFVFLLTSKMAILSLFVLMNFIFYLFITPIYGKLKTIFILAAINLAGLIIILSLPKTRERFTMMFRYHEVEYANSTESRTQIWKSGLEIAQRHFFTGVGSGDAEQTLVDQYSMNQFQKGVDERYNAHNQYLQFMIETGVLGLLLFLFVIFYSFRRAVFSKNFIYLSFLLLYCINIFTESMFKTQSGVVFYAFFNTLLGLHFSGKGPDLTKS